MGSNNLGPSISFLKHMGHPVELLPKGGRPRGDRVCGEPEREPAVGRLRRLPPVVARRTEGRGVAPRRDGRAPRNHRHVGEGPRAAGTPGLISG